MTKFTKIYNSFYGEKIESPEQITEIKMSGKELKQFCEFYFRELAIFDFNDYEEQARINDLRVIRLLWSAIGFLIAFFIILITFYFNGKI